MRRLWLLVLLATVAWAQTMSVGDLFANRTQYDGKPVTVSGTVKGYYEKDDFAAFLLFDSGKAVSVVTSTRPGLANDSHATVSGTFWVAKKVHSKNFSNVVEADSITP